MRLITGQQLKAELDAGQPLKLVMTAGPWQVRVKHIPGTLKLITPKNALRELRPDDPIVVYTVDDHLQSSTVAWEALTAHGYRNVRRYAGGLRDWEAAGYPVQGHSMATRPIVAGHTATAPPAASCMKAVRTAIRAGPAPDGPAPNPVQLLPGRFSHKTDRTLTAPKRLVWDKGGGIYCFSGLAHGSVLSCRPQLASLDMEGNVMAAQRENGFWSSAGGILAGIAALITAVLGVLTFLDRSGAIENPVGHSISQALPASDGAIPHSNQAAASKKTTAETETPEGKVSAITVTADPSSGAVTDCSGAGVLITFTGTITAAGTITTTHPLTINYHWERSDGATAPTPEPLVLTQAGSATVQTTWRRSGSPGAMLSGAQTLVIDAPNNNRDEASFNLACTES
jgi:rhodanese-related sulfurtransferase